MNEQNKVKTSPKDFFLHLLSMVALYASAISFTVIAFQSINLWVPDALEFANYYSENSARGLIRGGLSFLIIMFPVYLLTMWSLYKSYKQDNAKRNLWVRKWLLYFTLFAAALIIIITLVILMMTFLEGELTLRFILKLLSVFFVAGSIFGYYLWDLKDKEWGKMKYFVYLIIAIVLTAIVAGFINAGLPGQERERRLDERRVQNLETIQSQALNYYRDNEALPEDLAEMQKEFGEGEYYQDPESGQEYDYNKTSDLGFELCANFVLGDQEEREKYPSPRYVSEILTEASSWDHGAGEVCFERTIDQEKYEKQKDGNPDQVPGVIREPMPY